MKAVVFAYNNIGCIGIEALLRNGIEISAVFTHKDDPFENIWFKSVEKLSGEKGIPVYAPEDVNHPLWRKKIKALKPDILFSFYFRKILKDQVLGLAPKGGLNLHGSYLPKYRGRCPVNWAIINGEKETGVTLHYMTPRPDDGDIIAQKKIPISSEDTALTLSEKMVKESVLLLDEILPDLIKGTVTRKPQNKNMSTYFGGRKPEDGEIDWTKPAEEIRNLVRGLAKPWPGAFTFIKKTELRIWKVTGTKKIRNTTPGTVISVSPLAVACGKNALCLDFVQKKGGLYISGAQAVNDLKLAENMKFGKIP